MKSRCRLQYEKRVWQRPAGHSVQQRVQVVNLVVKRRQVCEDHRHVDTADVREALADVQIMLLGCSCAGLIYTDPHLRGSSMIFARIDMLSLHSDSQHETTLVPGVSSCEQGHQAPNLADGCRATTGLASQQTMLLNIAL